MKTTQMMLGLLLLAACMSSTGQEFDLNETGANGLLTPAAIFQRYVNAIGGEALIRSHTSTTMQGTFGIAAFGLTGALTMYSAAPNLALQVIDLGGLGQVRSGFDGTTGWNMDPLQGNTVITGDALKALIERSNYYLSLGLLDAVEFAETVEKTSINGEEVYKVDVANAVGGKTSLYFSSTSAYLLRTQTVVPSPLGSVPVTQDFSDFKSFGGFMVPTSLHIDQAGQLITMQFDSVSYDDVDPSVFDLPPAIQALLH